MQGEHVERLRVTWADTDASSRIHFTAAFRFAEVAETGLRRRLGLLEDWADYPRRHAEAEYRAVLVFEDEVDVAIRPARLGRTSITWEWEIRRAGETCIVGRHTVVHVDEVGRSSPLPGSVRGALEAFAQAPSRSEA